MKKPRKKPAARRPEAAKKPEAATEHEPTALQLLGEAMTFESTLAIPMGTHPDTDEEFHEVVKTLSAEEKQEWFKNITEGVWRCNDMTTPDVLHLSQLIDGACESNDQLMFAFGQVISEDLGGIPPKGLVTALLGRLSAVSQIFRLAQVALVAERGEDVFAAESEVSMREFAAQTLADTDTPSSRTYEEVEADYQADLAAEKQATDSLKIEETPEGGDNDTKPEVESEGD